MHKGNRVGKKSSVFICFSMVRMFRTFNIFVLKSTQYLISEVSALVLEHYYFDIECVTVESYWDNAAIVSIWNFFFLVCYSFASFLFIVKSARFVSIRVDSVLLVQIHKHIGICFSESHRGCLYRFSFKKLFSLILYCVNLCMLCVR